MKLQKDKITQGIDLFLCHVPGRTSSTDNITNALGHSHLLLILYDAYLSVPLLVPYILSYFLSFCVKLQSGIINPYFQGWQLSHFLSTYEKFILSAKETTFLYLYILSSSKF